MRAIVLFFLVVLLPAMGALGCAPKPDAVSGEEQVRIGVYDSRAIAVGWANTEPFNAWWGSLQAEYNQAKAAGDQKRVQELEAEAEARHRLMHMQAFSTAPVDDILASIEDSLPGIKEAAGVTMLVSKWDSETLAQYPSAELVDVTMMLVDAFHPSERQRQFAIGIQEKEPIPLEEAEKIQD
jgi:ABC-type sugar transport system substrate-binding protein